jgi:hypothetical protein
VWLALAVTIGGLFRPDLGVYGFLAAAVLVFLARDEGRWRDVSLLALFVTLWAAPWLLHLAWHGKLGDYLYISSLEATLEAAGRAKPPPWPDFSTGLFADDNVKAFLFRLPLLMLLLAATMIVLRRTELRGPLRTKIGGAFVLAALTSLLASHIVDWLHVRDTFAIRFLLLGWIAAGAWSALRQSSPRGRWALLPLGAVIILGGSTVLGALIRESERTASPLALAAKLREFCGDRAAVLAGVRERGESFRAELYEYVRDHSAPDETVFGVLECPQMNYFADRRFASRQMAIFPGYFASPRHQQRMMAQIRSGPTAFVVIDHLEMMDYPAGAMERFAPDVLRFLQDEFVLVAEIGYCKVLAPRWRRSVPPNAPTWGESLQTRSRRD